MFAIPHAVLFHLANALPSGQRHALVLTINPGVTMRCSAIAAHPVLRASSKHRVTYKLSIGRVWHSPSAEELERIKRLSLVRECKLCRAERAACRQDDQLEQLLARSIKIAQRKKGSTK